MKKNTIKTSALVLTTLLSINGITPMLASATENNESNIHIESLSDENIVENKDKNRAARQARELEVALQQVRTSEGKDLMNKSMSIQHQIENEILSKGYSDVEEYNNEIGKTIPVEESVYYNNSEYYATPLPEAIADDEERAIGLVLWGKAAFTALWAKATATTFGKAIAAGAGAAIGANLANDTRELIIKGYQKIYTHLKDNVVGNGRVTSGGKVSTAQRLLQQQGYNIAIDGIWGPQSEAATKKFQGSLNMSRDGLIGQHTWAYLIEHV